VEKEGRQEMPAQGAGCSEETQPWSRAGCPSQLHPVLPAPAPTRKLSFIPCCAKHVRLKPHSTRHENTQLVAAGREVWIGS